MIFSFSEFFWCLSVHPEVLQDYPGPPTGRRAPSIPKNFLAFFLFFCEKAFSFLELEVLIFLFFSKPRLSFFLNYVNVKRQ